MASPTAELTGAKRRIVETLKRAGLATATDLATRVGTTPAAVRQHLDTLESAGLVVRDIAPVVPGAGSSEPGRPATQWRVTGLARAVFPDRHSDLTVDLLESIRTTLGQQALDAVIDRRAALQIESYRDQIEAHRQQLPGDESLVARVRVLAERRSAEGYLAEVVPSAGGDDGHRGDRDVLLIEHHCPISDAARTCPSLCRSELDVFRAALGPAVSVERVQHQLAGDGRCSYRIGVRPLR
ncbi:MAG TPA: transcriptional regulator [Ilumatobacteraceae bacterium]|nr:transcriptional regulator [Ilumatobacteraceae bacterium]